MGLDIITCPQWHARQPKSPITTCARSKRVILHHTAGHHREIQNPRDESLLEAMRYAQDIQHAHMAPGGLGAPEGGVDSGHNFLVTRAGYVLQGRWLTVSAIEAGHMVNSAHCPTQNQEIGIEHEHLGNEKMTPEQRVASALLMAWIAKHYYRTSPLEIQPHRKYYATACPANLVAEIPALYKLTQKFIIEEAYL